MEKELFYVPVNSVAVLDEHANKSYNELAKNEGWRKTFACALFVSGIFFNGGVVVDITRHNFTYEVDGVRKLVNLVLAEKIATKKNKAVKVTRTVNN